MCDFRNVTLSCWNNGGYLAYIPYLRCLLSQNLIGATREHWLPQNILNALDDIFDTRDFFARASRNSLTESFGKERGQGGI